MTPYEQRVALVASVIAENSALDRTAADTLARLVLRAIDHVPEHVR
ncbi:hypothetical protein TOK_2605 [Pseudonocardia sp. N23]|nr:hypothetical protein TOK_2605 [Pseudonocardia sp. N23]